MAAERYTLFIDESGNESIKNLETGKNDPFLVLGGIIIKNSEAPFLRKTLFEISKKINSSDKGIHLKKLPHEKKVFICQQIAPLQFTSFGIISNKKEIPNWERAKILENPHSLYSKLTQYLLERYGIWASHHNIPKDKLHIVFEESAKINYSQIQNYISAIKNNTQRTSKKTLSALERISPQNISAMKKKDEPLLSLADIICHALYRCCSGSNSQMNILEYRYLRELHKTFFRNPTLIPHGLLIRPNIESAGLDPQIQRFLTLLNKTHKKSTYC